ncbi:Cyanase [Metarhizium album ARSEF 1941]|uniref:Cyanate hydratase n=1 Tax=Metarhizium album (strain ARSEF 1941) TaxID=1081103 RepID=A0A0B2X5U0_METAS|nr:Cyanase [Metarhizium album ARSEF 1941]KHO00676.1 Cyanase [Metarhizium album ARSEF 1941]
MPEQQQRLASIGANVDTRLPLHCSLLFQAKTAKNLTFAQIAQHLGRSEVACAGLFYGQVQASDEDVDKLSELLGVIRDDLAEQMMAFPNRGISVEMPPTEPLIYRLYEVVQNYGYAYKAVMNEKFGDGIMSGVCFKTDVDKEVDETGAAWAVITMKGKWASPPPQPYTLFAIEDLAYTMKFLYLSLVCALVSAAPITEVKRGIDPGGLGGMTKGIKSATEALKGLGIGGGLGGLGSLKRAEKPEAQTERLAPRPEQAPVDLKDDDGKGQAVKPQQVPSQITGAVEAVEHAALGPEAKVPLGGGVGL